MGTLRIELRLAVPQTAVLAIILRTPYVWRRVRDSNPEALADQRFSRPRDYQLSQLSIFWSGRWDSNPLSRKTPDLQSGPTLPRWRSPICKTQEDVHLVSFCPGFHGSGVRHLPLILNIRYLQYAYQLPAISNVFWLNPFHRLALFWQAVKDSNPNQAGWSRVCYRYTNDLYMAEGERFELSRRVSPP